MRRRVIAALSCLVFGQAMSACRYDYELLGDQASAGLGAAGEATSGSGGATSGSGSDSGMSSGGDDAFGGASLGGAATGGAGAGGNGPGGEGSGGAATGAGGTGTGGTGEVPETCGFGTTPTTGTYHVDTGVDEDNAVSLGQPGGAGLSLREAIQLANATGSPETISIEPGLIILLASSLPDLVEDVELFGNKTEIDASGVIGAEPCLTLAGGTSTIRFLSLNDCPAEPISIEGGNNHKIANSCFRRNERAITTSASAPGTNFGPFNLVSGSRGRGVVLRGANDWLNRATILNPADDGVVVESTATNVRIQASTFTGARNGAVVSATSGVQMWHNIIVRNDADGLVTSGATQVDFRNNIVTHNSGFGIRGAGAEFQFRDYNLFFDNPSGPCSSCTPNGFSKEEDPLYVDYDGRDYRPTEMSPSVDAAQDLGWDNLPFDAARFAGSGPEMGHHELIP